MPGVSKRHGWYSDDDGTDNIDADKVAWVELRGPMDCSVYSQEKWDGLLKRLGPDPLNGDGPERMVAKVAKSRKPIGELLMDQTVAAGVGNILSGGAVVSGAVESVSRRQGCGGEDAAVDMERGGRFDEGRDGGSQDCDDEACGSTA